MGQGYIGGGGSNIKPRILCDTNSNQSIDNAGSLGQLPYSYGTAPVAGTYVLQTTFQVSSIAGAGPQTITVKAHPTKKIYISNPSTHSRTQLYAAGATIASAAKGSDFAAGDTYVATSSPFTLAAGESIVTETAGSQLFKYWGDAANAVVVSSITELVLQ